MVRANDMRKAENPMETPLATDAGLVFIGCIHPPWTSRMETPVVFGGLLVDQLATHDRSRCSGDLCDVPGHSSLAAVEPREKGSRVLLIAVYLVLPRSEENTALLMTDLWSFDPNVEIHKAIKQRCFPVQTAVNHVGGRSSFGSRFQ